MGILYERLKFDTSARFFFSWTLSFGRVLSKKVSVKCWTLWRSWTALPQHFRAYPCPYLKYSLSMRYIWHFHDVWNVYSAGWIRRASSETLKDTPTNVVLQHGHWCLGVVTNFPPSADESRCNVPASLWPAIIIEVPIFWPYIQGLAMNVWFGFQASWLSLRLVYCWCHRTSKEAN